MKYRILAVLLFFSAFSWAQKIDNVYFRVDGKEVVVTYDLSGCERADVALFLSTNSGRSFSSLPLEGVTGDVGRGIKTGRREIYWNPYIDFPNGISATVVFKVKCVSDADLGGDKKYMSQNVIYANMMSERDGIFPVWFQKLIDEGCRVGVSPPTYNRVDARRLALVNILLTYLHEKGGAVVRSYAELSSKDEGNDDDYIKNVSEMKETVHADLKNIGIVILNEYYNYRGEYFIAYKFDETSSLKMGISLQRSLDRKVKLVVQDETKEKEFIIYGNHEKEQNILHLQNLCDISTPWGNFGFSYKFVQNGSLLKSSCVIDSGKELPSEKKSIRYDNTSMVSHQLKCLPYTESFPLTNSLGMTELDVLNTLPIIADTILVRTELIDGTIHSGDEKSNEEEILSSFSSRDYYEGIGRSKPTQFFPKEIDDNTLIYSFICDNHFVGGDSIRKIDGYGDSYIYFSSLSKSSAFYSAISQVASENLSHWMNKRTTIGNAWVDNVRSRSFVLLTDFYLDWKKSRILLNEKYSEDFSISIYVDMKSLDRESKKIEHKQKIQEWMNL